MRTLPALLALTAVALTGCAKPGQPKLSDSAPATEKSKPADPVEAEREGIHEAAFQLGNAAQDLQKAIDAAKALRASTKNPDLKAALDAALESLDDAGASIADFTEAPPELEEFKKRFSELDQKRLDAIDGANDAMHDLDDVSDGIGDFEDNPAEADAEALGNLDDALSDASDDLTTAIKALGGKVESDDTEDVVPDSKDAPPQDSTKGPDPNRPDL